MSSLALILHANHSAAFLNRFPKDILQKAIQSYFQSLFHQNQNQLVIKKIQLILQTQVCVSNILFSNFHLYFFWISLGKMRMIKIVRWFLLQSMMLFRLYWSLWIKD
jgi:hypothetical protein